MTDVNGRADHEVVRRERESRGWSKRDAAKAGNISNETWGRYESTGHLTPKMRQAVASAFDWPLSWPDEAATRTASPDYRLGALERRVAALVRALQAVVEEMQADAATESSLLAEHVELLLRDEASQAQPPGQ